VWKRYLNFSISPNRREDDDESIGVCWDIWHACIKFMCIADY
jgi:hypothetical protein